jgi:hypothetical protein
MSIERENIFDQTQSFSSPEMPEKSPLVTTRESLTSGQGEKLVIGGSGQRNATLQ